MRFSPIEKVVQEKDLYMFIYVYQITLNTLVSILQLRETVWFSSAVQIFHDFIKSSLNSSLYISIDR